MNKLRPVSLQIHILNLAMLNNYLLTITYKHCNNYIVKTFSFKSSLELFKEHEKLLFKYPYLTRKKINV